MRLLEEFDEQVVENVVGRLPRVVPEIQDG